MTIAFNQPPTQLTGDLITAAAWNIIGANNQAFLYAFAVGAKGADVVAANNLVLAQDGNFFKITGATQINRISNIGWPIGSRITLSLDGGGVIKNGFGSSGTNINIRLGANNDYTCSNLVIALVYDGTNWVEAPGFHRPYGTQSNIGWDDNEGLVVGGFTLAQPNFGANSADPIGMLAFGSDAVVLGNELALSTDGNYHHVPNGGDVYYMDVNHLVNGWSYAFVFDGVTTIRHNHASSSTLMPFLLNGSADFVSAANTVLTVILSGYTGGSTGKWIDITRKS